MVSYVNVRVLLYVSRGLGFSQVMCCVVHAGGSRPAYGGGL